MKKYDENVDEGWYIVFWSPSVAPPFVGNLLTTLEINLWSDDIRTKL